MDPTKKANTAKVANKKGGSSGNQGHFPNTGKDKTKYTRFVERKKLKVEGRCYIGKKSAHIANECLEKNKVSATCQTINNYIRLRTTLQKIKSVSVGTNY